MRNLFLLLLTFVSISPLGLLAQLPAIPMRLQAGKTLGRSEYFVDYTYRHKTPAESKDFQEDIIRVELGKALVKSYSYRLWQADSLLAQITNPNGTMQTPEGGLSPFYYYRDLTNGTTQVYYRTPLSGPTLKYTDTPTFSWTLTGEKKVISGYEAQRATCQFRGRSYEAWFTPSIPISAGPNFFGGLPGLILELHSMDGAHHFVLDALCQRSADIVEWKIRSVKSVSRTQFRDYYQRLHKHPIQTFEANGQRVYPRDAQGKFLTNAEALSWAIPFNPIELE